MQSFDYSIAPFDRLTERERNKIGAALDIGYFRAGETIIAEDAQPEHLYVIIKGLVAEHRNDEVVDGYVVNDCFDAVSLVKGPSESRYDAQEETLAHMIPRKLFADLARDNPEFGDFFFRTMSERLEEQARHDSAQGMASFMVAKVSQAYLHPPIHIDGSTSIRDASRLMKAKRATSLLVDRPDGPPGVLSGTDIRDAVIIEELPLETKVSDIATFDVVTIKQDDYLFNAQLLMTSHGIKRLPVVSPDGSRVDGVLELIDLLSFMSSHSHLVTLQIDRAETVMDLKKAGDSIQPLLQALHGSGLKIKFVTELVTTLNRQIFQKLFRFLAPPVLAENACLIVMGSEGRGEQILRTDQDNALILRDGAVDPKLALAFGNNFTQALISFGYPPCPGNMMVSNAVWNKPVSEFETDIHRWINQPNEQRMMDLAAFLDSTAIAGDESLLAGLRQTLFRILGRNDIFYGHFAKAIEGFDPPLGIFGQVVTESGEHAGQIDIKKGGIFPVVHGVRALALQKGISDINTFERIEALVEMGVLEKPLGKDLTACFEFLLDRRLHGRLEKLSLGVHADNYIQVDNMDKIQRDALKDAFGIVKEFKKRVVHHFKLAQF